MADRKSTRYKLKAYIYLAYRMFAAALFNHRNGALEALKWPWDSSLDDRRVMRVVTTVTSKWVERDTLEGRRRSRCKDLDGSEIYERHARHRWRTGSLLLTELILGTLW